MNVAFIPLRGGSKSIPLKNIKNICGRPLIYWVLDATEECPDIDITFIATDSEQIKNVIEKYKSTKIRVIGRSPESATDTASTEFVMLEFAEKYEFDNIALIQATSPLLTAGDLSRGFQLFNIDDTDSVLSVVRQKRFLWEARNGMAFPLNYDYLNRPRRQDFKGFLVENGAFYITSKEALMRTKCRVSGNIRLCEMGEETYFEIDEPSDWVVIEHLLNQRYILSDNQNKEKIQKIKMFLTDCDGCLTDGGMYYSENGDELKKFNTKDGMGLSLLRESGIITGIITREKTEIVSRRAKKLCIEELHLGIKDKVQVVKELCKKYDISLDEVAYIGDDINDIDLIRAVGFGCSVNNAEQVVKDSAKYVTKRNGGEGAIREIVNLILASH